jgi:P63C domain
MTDEKIASIPSMGGKARAEILPPQERKDIAQRAAIARWGKDLPRATHSGAIVIAGRRISCAVLETGKRLLTQETFLTSIGRAGKAKAGTGSFTTVDGLPPFLAAENLKDFISEELRQSTTPIFFRNDKGIRAAGYEAKLLPLVCEVYLKFRDKKFRNQEAIPINQKHIVEACDLLMRGLAHVGIVALVDEATGYQEYRAKDELSRILEAYIAEELRPWIRTFPEEFFKQLYRIHNWPYRVGSTKRTQYVGKLINKLVYEQLPPPVLPTLKELNPVTEKGYRKHKHFQFLTADTGNIHLDRQITAVTMLLKVSDDKADFWENFKKAFAKEYQPRLALVVDVEKTG